MKIKPYCKLGYEKGMFCFQDKPAHCVHKNHVPVCLNYRKTDNLFALYRIQMGLNRGELAKMLDISRRDLYNIEMREKPPSLRFIKHWAKRLRCKMIVSITSNGHILERITHE